jgi:glycerophosphoryl diester phosphodiesterase
MSRKPVFILLLSLILAATLIQFGCFGEKVKLITVAHRGASGTAPENTLASFRQAIQMGANFTELDVQLSKDGYVVLLHDSTLDRTTDGTGPVRNYTLAELKKLDAGSSFAPEFAGEPLPTLDEVIRLVRGKMKVDIEIKVTRFDSILVKKVVEIVRAQHFASNCMITSFNRASIEEAKRIAPEIKTGLIINKLWNDEEFKGNWDILGVKYTLIDADFINKAKKAHKEIYAYTVNDPEAMKKLVRSGIAGIITNYPELLKSALSEMEKAK